MRFAFLLMIGWNAGCIHKPDAVVRSHVYACTWVNPGQECAPVMTTCAVTERQAIEYCISNAAQVGRTNNGVVLEDPC